MPWKTISDADVRHIWAPDAAPAGEDEITVAPSWYADNGTPVDPESGDDMAYVRTEVHVPEPVRYVSAEAMQADDFGVPFTNKLGEIVYDAKTKHGPWATMTQRSYEVHGVGLGLGLGQMYVRNVEGQLVKVAG
jgi:hypothetical protein